MVVLDNASIHHAIDPEVHERWLREHRMQLFYLPPYSPELNLIGIIGKQAKYHWRHFVTWPKETIDDEVRSLLGAYGTHQFHLNTYFAYQFPPQVLLRPNSRETLNGYHYFRKNQ